MLTLLQAQAQGGGLSMIIMLVAIFAIMYFFMIRPQNKQRKKLQQFRDSLTVGQKLSPSVACTARSRTSTASP